MGCVRRPLRSSVEGTAYKLAWSYADPTGTEVVSLAAVAGGRGHQVIVFGDVSGAVHVLSLATGQDLYNCPDLRLHPLVAGGHRE